MKNLFILLLFTISFPVFSQTEEDRTYGKLEKDSLYLLYDNVNLRSDASSNASVVKQLKIGTPVKLIRQTDSQIRINGFTNKWIYIEVLDKDRNTTGEKGYIWAGFIAESIMFSKEDNGVCFLWGISQIKSKDGFDEISLQVRAVRDTIELSRIDFPAIGSITTSNLAEIYGSKGLKSVYNIIRFNFSDNMCAGAFGDVYIFWDKTKLHHVKTLRGGADAPYFSNENLVFPDDEGGKKGKIIFKEEAGELQDDGSTKYEYQRQTEYTWNGKELSK